MIRVIKKILLTKLFPYSSLIIRHILMSIQIEILIIIEMNRQTVDALIEKYGGPSQSRTSDWNREPTRSRISYGARNCHSYNSRISIESEDRPMSSIENELGAFMMSRSECEQFLDRVREQLRYQQIELQGFSQNSIKHIHEKFQQNHEKIRELILDLLQKAFRKNERYITEQLKRHQQIYPKEFDPIYDKINSLQNQIKHFQNGLKSLEYKNSIVKIITRDFPKQITNLRAFGKKAKNDYLKTMGEVEPDGQRIQCIKDDLEKLFKISKRSIRTHYRQSEVRENSRAIEIEQENQNPKEKEGIIKSIFKFC